MMKELLKKIFTAALIILLCQQVVWGADETPPQTEDADETTEQPGTIQNPMIPVIEPPKAAAPLAPSPMQNVSPIPATVPPANPNDVKIGDRFLSFDNTDLVEVINLVASILKLNYIIDPKVTGTVSIHTEGTISKGDLPLILDTILRINGVVKIEEDGLTHFVPSVDAKIKGVYPQVGNNPDALKVNQKFIIQVVKLEYIKITEAMKIIKNYQPLSMNIIEYNERNMLIISDVDVNVKKMMKMISLFDVDIFKDARVKVYPLINAPTIEVTKELEGIFKMYDYPTNTGRGVGIVFFPIVRINAVLAVATNSNLIEQAEKWIKELDKSASENMVGIFIYNVQNAKAEELAAVLSKIFTKKQEKEKEFKKNILIEEKKGMPEKAPATGEAAAPAGTTGEKPPVAGATTPTAGAGDDMKSADIEDDINIVTDLATNSIIVKATRKDYDVILDTMKKLDVFPKQVLIEVTIAEVLLDAKTQFGIEWQYTHGFGSGSNLTASTGVVNGAAGSIGSGLVYAVTNSDTLTAAIRASAQDNKVNILSSPRIIASDNKKAQIEIGEDVPIVTSVYRTNDASSTATTVNQTIQYRSTGILLNVIPRINEAGLVRLDITQEVSEVSERSVSGVQSPVIFKRSATTTIAVNDNETIVIGGLMKEKKTKNNSGVPLLSKIPILGYFFSYTADNIEKTELMILFTPKVIKGSEDSKQVTYEYKNKVDAIKEEFKKAQEENK